MSEFPVEVRNLTKTFSGKKPFTAVDAVSFALRPGEVLGLLGPNGAGKTTTIQMLLSTLTPTAGEILYFGKPLNKNRSEILQSVGCASSYSRFPGDLTAAQVLNAYSHLYNLSRSDTKKRMTRLLERFDVLELKDKSASSLSAGQATRFMLIKAFLPYPKVVLLDEPTASLDPEIAVEVLAFIKEQQKEYGVAIVYTSHIMSEVSELCDRVVFLKQGKVLAIDTPERLASRVGNTRLRLAIDAANKDAAERLFAEKKIAFSAEGENFQLFVEESQVAEILFSCGVNGIKFTAVEIDKPTLEEFFLKVSNE